MTKTARRGSMGRALPATPWTYLKRRFSSKYHVLQNKDVDNPVEDVASLDHMDTDESSSGASKTSKSDLKETHKAKLSGSSVKRFFQKIKQKISGKKLRRQLTQSEITPLLDEPGLIAKTEDVKRKSVRSKKMKRKTISSRKSRCFKEEKIQLLEEEEEEEIGDSDGIEETDGATYSQPEESSMSTYQASCSIQWRSNKSKKGHQLVAESELVKMVDAKREKRIEARRQRRRKGKVCFNCRQSGHIIDECPQSEFSATGICFKCGAADHTSKMCRANVERNEYPYAKCFICDEVGHLSRSCPLNPRGVYPQGGGCKVCGSVEHLKANCPEVQRNEAKVEPWGSMSLVIGNQSVDAEDYGVMDSTPATQKLSQSTRKVVHF